MGTINLVGARPVSEQPKNEVAAQQKRTVLAKQRLTHDIVDFRHSHKQKQSFLGSIMSFTGNFFQMPNKTPEIYIIDTFNKKQVDVDGDGVKDISHGKTVATILKSKLPQANLHYIRLKTHPGANQMAIQSDSIVSQMDALTKSIKDGKKVDGINMSLGYSISYDFASFLLNKKIDRSNIAEHKNEVRDLLIKGEIPQDKKKTMSVLMPGATKSYGEAFKTYSKFINSLQNLADTGVPITVAAGNDGVGYFSPSILVDKVIMVGATDASGYAARFSSDNSLVNAKSQGVFNVTEIKSKSGKVEGFDITGSGKAEILTTEVSGKENPTKKFIGKKITDVLASGEEHMMLDRIFNDPSLKNISEISQNDPEFDKKVSKMNEKLYSSNTMLILNGVIPSIVTDLNGSHYFKVNKNLIVESYDYDKSGRPGINTIQGTSFSAPNYLAELISKKTRPDNPSSNDDFFHDSDDIKSA